MISKSRRITRWGFIKNMALLGTMGHGDHVVSGDSVVSCVMCVWRERGGGARA